MSNGRGTGGSSSTSSSNEDIIDEEDAPLSCIRHERPNLGPEDVRASQVRRTEGEMNGIVPVSFVGHLRLDSISPIISDLIQQELKSQLTDTMSKLDEVTADVIELKAEQEQIRAEFVQLKAEQEQIRAESVQLKAESVQLKAEQEQIKAEIVQLKAEQELIRAEFVQFKQQHRDEAVRDASPLLQIEEGLPSQTGTNTGPSQVGNVGHTEA